MSTIKRVFKVIFIGNSLVGKTSLIHRITHDSFYENEASTIGVDFRIKLITINKDVFKVQFWDTSGQERFRSLVKNYYRGSDAVLILYDVTDPTSYDDVSYWIKEINKVCTNKIPSIFIVGNKVDLEHDEMKGLDEYPHMLVSALSGKGVNELLLRVVDTMETRYEEKQNLPNSLVDVNLNNSVVNNKKNTCCSIR
jgi:small GTP-binding protein